MESNEFTYVNNILASTKPVQNYAFALFVLLGMVLAYVVYKNHKLSIKDTLLFILGFKKVALSTRERLLHFSVITVPLLVLLIAIQLNAKT